MIKAIQVIAKNDFTILVQLEDNRNIKLDMSFIKKLEGPVVNPIKELNEFKKVFIRNGIVTWPTGYDIDPYFLIEESTQINKIA